MPRVYSRATETGVLLRQVLDDHVELLDLDHSYRDGFGPIGLRARMVREPANQILRGASIATLA